MIWTVLGRFALRYWKPIAGAAVVGTLLSTWLLVAVLTPFLSMGGALTAAGSADDTEVAQAGLGVCNVGSVPADAASLTMPGLPAGSLPEARTNGATIVAVAKTLMGADWAAAAKVGLGTGMQESHLINLPGGDADSIGVFQQRAQYYGTVIPHDVTRAATAFFVGAEAVNGAHIGGLKDVPGWQNMTMAQAAQAVQRSAFPTAYAKWEQTAATWVAALAGTTAGVCPQIDGGKVPYQSKFVDCATAHILDTVAAKFGGVHLTQGSWSTDVEASGGTHAGAGASDWAPGNGDWDGAAKYARTVGGLAWHRGPPDFETHIHMIVPGVTGMAQPALDQISAFQRGENGIGGTDPGWPFTPFKGSPGCGQDGGTGAGGASVASVWVAPLANPYFVTAEFGEVASIRSGPHQGTDLSTFCGDTVMAAAAGTVIHSGPGVAWAGNYVVIDHGGGLQSWYAHMATQPLVEQGQKVTPGQPLGPEGRTGNASGCHVHYQMEQDNQLINPRQFMAAHGVVFPPRS